jgi:plastocyanin
MSGKKLARWNLQSIAALMVLGGYFTAAYSAEVRGTVVVDYEGLFEVDGGVQGYAVSVALIPDQGQHVVPRGVATQRIEIVENRMHPAFMTVKQGDRVEFINRDPVFHELFSLSPGEPVSVRLDKGGNKRHPSASMVLDEAGTTHIFCRIHNKSYARIDVVATPYLQMVQPGHKFHFVGLAGGRWKLRLASPAAETQWLPVTALTTPPPLHLTLVSRDGGRGAAKLRTQVGVAQLYQGPVD